MKKQTIRLYDWYTTLVNTSVLVNYINLEATTQDIENAIIKVYIYEKIL